MLYHFGTYLIMLRQIFTRPEKFSVFRKLVIHDIYDFGINSVGIVSFMSLFVGAVVTVQTAVYIDSPLLPKYLIGLVARDSIILEFAPTMIAIILAGKIGSNIASNIGNRLYSSIVYNTVQSSTKLIGCFFNKFFNFCSLRNIKF